MTIRTREEEVPQHFAPCRLFLDDIEQIVYILREAVLNLPVRGGSHDDLELSVTFSVGDQQCDEIADLPKIARQSSNFAVHVSRGTRSDIWLTISRYSFTWQSLGLTKDEEWGLFRKLQSVVRRRRLGWRSVAHAHPTLGGAVFAAVSLGGSAGLFLLGERKFARGVAFLILSGFCCAALARIAFRHSTVVLSHYHESSPLALYMKEKLIPVVVSAIVGALIGVGGTILGLYLKHNYWP